MDISTGCIEWYAHTLILTETGRAMVFIGGLNIWIEATKRFHKNHWPYNWYVLYNNESRLNESRLRSDDKKIAVWQIAMHYTPE